MVPDIIQFAETNGTDRKQLLRISDRKKQISIVGMISIFDE